MTEDKKNKTKPEELTDDKLEDAQGGLSLNFGSRSSSKLHVPTGGIAQTAIVPPKVSVKQLKTGGVGETPPLDLDPTSKKV